MSFGGRNDFSDPDTKGVSHYRHVKSPARLRREALKKKANLAVVRSAQSARSSHLGVVPDGFKIANVFLKRMEHENPPSVQVLIPDIVNINKWVADAFKNGVSGWDVNGRFQYFIPREEISEIRA
jgi:hypothetical protein